ncbi:NACHT domain-containing protein [Luteolibacter sp. GHJ8]|uniref:NACHT domain-containing protein n=1 Tax=Luteolibacter rhizosphaerae TaxID=2989719 RepID=A0ABT3G6Y0_9BACT|nr:NACHT domain-containing protein [Luteolibacter rhizosphaerae]MCW1915604.1 NACHT domain-containing protein [Luteolibacter rhizosphaerae]
MPDPATPTLILTAAAVKKLVESATSDLYTLAKSHLNISLKKLKIKKQTDTIFKNIIALRKVKTILQTEREVDLTTFYYPAKAIIGRERVTINQLEDFKHDGNILLEGTAGLGKSTLLRYLATVDFCLNRKIPVFIELRKARGNARLVDNLIQELNDLGIECDVKIFELLASEGRITIFLDAFDEAKHETREELISDIQSLSRRFEKIQFVITSRPDTGISSCPFLRVFKVAELEDNDHEEIIKKMCASTSTATTIIQQINKESTGMRDLLTTPLMVALLVIRHRIDQSIPQNGIAFYDSLFPLLLLSHDKNKGGYTRPRKSKLEDSSLEDFFNTLSFITRKEGETSFTTKDLSQHAKTTLQILAIKMEPDNLLSDIIDITCLMVRDSEEVKYIHKSVQEYHAALCIKNHPDKNAVKFYETMAVKWHAWRQELIFLSQIDRYRFEKYFRVPSFTALLLEKGSKVGQNKFATKFFGDDILTIDKETRRLDSYTWESSKHYPINNMTESNYITELINLDYSSVDINKSRDSSGTYRFKLKDLLQDISVGSKISDLISIIHRELESQLNEAKNFVASIESRRAVFEF